MKVEIRNNQVTIEGYVNAVERDSRILPKSMSPRAQKSFVERVRAKTFQRAIEKNDNIEVRFNHSKALGSTKEKNLELREDNIGLYARAIITDEEVIEKAKNKELRGWSFGFVPIKDDWEDVDENLQRRTLEDIDLSEVSILTKTPAYIATSIEMRGEDCYVKEIRGKEEEKIETTIIDYSLHEKRLNYLKIKNKN